MPAGGADSATTPRRTPAVGVTPLETRHDVVLHLADRAEALGYDAFLLAEGWGHDAAVLLAVIAGRTRRIRLGTGVLNIWGRSAAGIAMLASSLDAVSGGRFVLGLGAGSPQLAEGLHGQPFADPVARLGSVTREVRALLSGGRTAGSPAQPGLRLAVPPRPEIPVHLAALGPRGVRLAGELADAWYPFLLPRSGLADGITVLREAAVRAGRPVPLVSPGLPVAVAEGPATGRALASWWVATYLLRMGPLYASTLRRHGLGAAVDAVLAANPAPRTTEVPASAEVLLDELTVQGGRTELDRWYDAGVDQPILVLPPGRPVPELEYALEALRPSTTR
jgi:alkanesulfonate monooxygenase SsuD/methylene tetrahydromethanopterin reductase-like flavin-dependent oxidoreductase (luciferase family)